MGSTATTEPPTAGPTTGEPSALERHRAGLLFALVVAAALLRLPLLDRSIWFDEACMSSQRIGTTSQLLATLYTDIHPPLFVAFMHLWNACFGDGEVVMRLPAMITGLLCIPLTYWVGHRLISPRAALLAATLLALSPVHVWYCTEARLYAPMMLTALFAFGCIDRLTDERLGKQRWLYWAHLSNVFVMLALHYYLAVIVVALAGIAPVLARGMSTRARSLLLWHGIGIMLLAGFIMVKLQLGEFETSQGYLRTLDPTELFRFLFDWCWTGNTMQAADSPLLTGLAVGHRWLGVGLVALGLGYILSKVRTHARALLVPLGVILLPCFLLACALIGYGNTYMERTLIAAVPFVFLLAMAGLELFPSTLRRVLGGLAVVLSATALLTLYGSFDSKCTLYKPHPDWRSAAKYLGSEIDAGHGGSAVFTSMPNPRSLSYYDVRIQDAKNLAVELSSTDIGNKVRKRLGSMLGDYAEATFADFAAHNQSLLDGAELIVRRCQATPALLDLTSTGPTTDCYLVRNKWHPHVSVDGSVEALIAHPDVLVLHTEHFAGVTVYKVRITK